MLIDSRKQKLFFSVILTAIFLILSSTFGAAKKTPQKLKTPADAPFPDPEKYITVDEIEPNMPAYCLTVLKGTEIEKIELEVLSVVRNFTGKRNVIMVTSKDQRFVHPGAIAGCSGSPVYIDGRMAGALALGWSFSKDPLYGVTPIEEMLVVGSVQSPSQPTGYSYSFDFSQPIDFTKIDECLTSIWSQAVTKNNSINPLPVPVSITGASDHAIEQFNDMFDKFGFTAVAAPVGAVSDTELENSKLEPGSVLTVPLVTGDIQLAATGTTTEVIGDKVYGFGHSFFGQGPIELPMANGKIHTVVASISRSFKLGSPGKILGSLVADESTAIYGQIGKEPKMIPLSITVERFNLAAPRVYNCRIAYHKILSSQMLRSAISIAAFQQGPLPPEHTIAYDATIEIEDGETIKFNNISTGVGIASLSAELGGTVALLMNNSFKEIEVKSIKCRISQTNRNISSAPWSIDIPDVKVKAGEQIDIEVVISPIRGTKKKYSFTMVIPENLRPGKYELLITGGYGYHNFLTQSASHKFLAQNIDSMFEAVDTILSIQKDRLYCILKLPAGGIILNGKELPNLPGTKSLVLIDPSRTLEATAHQHWLQKNIKIDTVLSGEGKMTIEVQE